MGRPKRVVFENFHLYDKFHTEKAKMYSGVEMTTLYAIKETEKFYMGIEVWAFCASKFKAAKANKTLEVKIPIITDEKTIKFLEENCWVNYSEQRNENSDFDETITLLNRLFPDKKKHFIFELDGIISTYCNGGFLPKKLGDMAKYYNQKYNKFCEDEEVKTKMLKWTSEKDEDLRKQYLKEYRDFEKEYTWLNHNLVDVLNQIGENCICYPVAFSRGTAEWSKEKYGKEIAYAKAGEIFFVVTNDSIYYEIKRHY